jgi:spore germination protein YaaH
MLPHYRRLRNLSLCIVTSLLVSGFTSAQDLPSDSPHADAMRQHSIESYLHAQDESPDFDPSPQSDHLMGAPFNIVYGWFPYWIGTSATSGIKTELLTHIAWFSVGVDTATGALGSTDQWKTTGVVTWAKGKGLKVHLTITCFGSAELRALLSSPAKRARCIADIVGALDLRQADGVNIDFESLPASQRVNMVSFIQALRAALPQKEITIATPSVDWNSSWDYATLARIADFLVIMGYDYYWSGSTTAGPVSPLKGETYNLTRSIDAHLNAGVEPERLVAAVPLYGRTWTVSSTARKASVVAGTTSSTPTYSSAFNLTGMSSRLHDEPTRVSWFNDAASAVIKQTWIDDSLSLDAKYRHIKSKGLRGVGFWALGYDGGRSSMWDGLRAMVISSSLSDDHDQVSPTDTDVVDVYTVIGQHVFSGSIRDLSITPLLSGIYVQLLGHRSTLIYR